MSRARFAGMLIVIAAAARSLSLGWLHPLNWDEIEYFRATDWVRQGLVPYRDFWEHHTPLQWFVFAPVANFVHSPGVPAIIAMRWAQVPLWIATFVLLSLWMRGAGLSLPSRFSAIALALCSSMFMLPAVEYRIDSLGCGLYVLALVLLQRNRNFEGGAALCLAGFANIRLGPLLALTVFLWLFKRSRVAVIAGGFATFALCSIYFLATHSAAIAFRRVWTENYLADKLSEGTGGVFLHRLAGVIGWRPLTHTFDAAAIDVATICILILGVIGLVRALIARHDHLFELAILQLGNILFIAVMKFVYTYHFEITILLMLPFVASEIERLVAQKWAVVAAMLVLASGVNVFASIFRGKEADLAYQDLIMREVDSLTPEDGKVFDGVGWALRRRPAYRYWFLPKLVQRLEAKGLFESYDARRDPPSAIITDHNAYVWLELHPQTAAFATSHYLPVWRNLWLPGMSARLNAGESAEWIVLATGTYRVYASEALSMHLWFRNPLPYGTFESRNTRIDFPRFRRSDLQLTADGIPIAPNAMRLSRGQHLRVVAPRTLGVMIVPSGIRSLFQQPPPGVTLDAAAPPATHVPFR
ncbi:MAG TPA: glycosyltransferase family 87 protein [Thermoanaerobaculia bacterium]